MADIAIIIKNGTAVVYLPVGDTSGICCNKAITKKKILLYRRNCSSKNLGKNENALYLHVLKIR